MVEMSNAEDNAQLFPQFKQNAQQPNGICPAGYCDSQSISRMYEFTLAKGARNAFGKREHENMMGQAVGIRQSAFG